jgi:hypothetical protein
MNPSDPPNFGAAGSAPEQANSLSRSLAVLMPTPLSWLYLALAVAGAILPWLANLAFIQQYGQAFDVGMFIGLANANPASQSLSRDLAIGATAVTIWMVSESKRLQMKGMIWVLLSCVTIAFAFGAPLFLYLRERRLVELRRQGWIVEP